MSEKFERERGHVARLLTRLGVEPSAALSDPNAERRCETGADVLLQLGGRRIGVQVTELDTGRRRGEARGREMMLARAAVDPASGDPRPYFTWAQADKPQLLASIRRCVETKVRARPGGFDETWLLIAAGVPAPGAIGATFLWSAMISALDLDSATEDLLPGSAYARAFLVPELNTEDAWFAWSSEEPAWTKGGSGPHPTLSLDEQKARAADPLMISDSDAWVDREIARVLQELRGNGSSR